MRLPAMRGNLRLRGTVVVGKKTVDGFDQGDIMQNVKLSGNAAESNIDAVHVSVKAPWAALSHLGGESVGYK